MAHNLPTEHEIVRADQYLALGLAALERESVLPKVFTMINGDRFKGAPSTFGSGAQLGQAVNHKLARVAAPARDYNWRTRTDPIVLDRIGTVTQQIILNQHIYHGVAVTNEQLTFDLTDFAAEIALPQAEALREKFEANIVKGLEAAPFKVTNANAAEADDPYKYALKLRALLNKQGTPDSGRVLLVGDDVETWLLGTDRLSRLQETGSTDALRRATLGDIAGFRVVRSSLIAPNAVYALHPSALLVANVAPDLPLGHNYASRQAYNGMSMLLVRDYDQAFQQSRSVISTYFGINSVNDELTKATQADVDAGRASLVGAPILDADTGNPTVTGKNVRGAKGTVTLA